MHGLLILFLQIALVLLLARVLGRLFRYINQPQVIGEMVAGILLGPSLLGWLAPGAFAFLFPAESMGALETLSQIGLLFFMFLVGLELEPGLVRQNLRTAVVTSQVSIIVPFALGTGLAFYLYPTLTDTDVPFAGFALFMGAAMSVTAFPVLSRILTERNMLQTRLGAVTIACAAVDDVTAWLILAGVIALVRASGGMGLVVTLIGTVVFVGVALTVLRPLLRRLEAYYLSRGRVTQDALAVVLLLLLAAAWTTEWLGVHALFGAFVLGAVMPRHRGFVRDVTEKLEDLTVVFFLPLFFAYTGLRTQIGLLDRPALWLDCLLIILVAVAGKFGGSALAARATGLTWRESGALGILMNTRGLMELVILTIGLDLGVIPPLLFAMMVLMALVTTFMTTPLLERIYPSKLLRSEALAAEQGAYAVLLPVSLPSSGPELLRVGRALVGRGPAHFFGLHLSRTEQRPLFGAQVQPPDEEALQPLLDAARDEQVAVQPLSFVSRDPGRDIVEVAHVKGVKLIVMGWHKPVLSRSVLSGTVGEVMREARADVVVYLARQFGPWRRVLVPFLGSTHDRRALEMAGRLAEGRPELRLTILHVVKPDRTPEDPRLGLSSDVQAFHAERLFLKIVEHDDPVEAVVQEARMGYDLVLVGATEDWGLEPTLFGLQHERLARSCPASMLIVHRFVPPTDRSDEQKAPVHRPAAVSP